MRPQPPQFARVSAQTLMCGLCCAIATILFLFTPFSHTVVASHRVIPDRRTYNQLAPIQLKFNTLAYEARAASLPASKPSALLAHAVYLPFVVNGMAASAQEDEGSRHQPATGTPPTLQPVDPTSDPTATPLAAATPHAPTFAPYAGPSPLVHLPALIVRTGTSDCAARIQVQNLGAVAVKAVLLTWRDETVLCGLGCNPPRQVECSGLIGPGRSWVFARASLDERAESGQVFSLSGETADRLCASLQSAVLDRCDGYMAFRTAWERGESFQGIALNAARGGPLAVEVVRDCIGDATGSDASASYAGIAASGVGMLNPELGGYFYDAPLMYADKGSMSSMLFLQNAGIECETVEVWFKAQDDCLRAEFCTAFVAVAPGETRRYDASDCVAQDSQGSALIRSSGPLAVVVDTVGRDMLLSYNGVPEDARDAAGAIQPADSPVAFAPLTFSEYQGWDTGIQVQNMSRTVNAKVKVYFLDQDGKTITTLVDWICPRGSQTFFLPVIHDLPGWWAGSVRVESQEWWSPGSPPVEPPNVSAVVQLIHYNDAARTYAREAATYNLLGEQDSYVWPEGQGKGGLESGVGLIALPLVIRGPDDSDITTEIGVSNLVPKPGFTDFAVILFDQNGHFDDACLTLGAQQAVYLDLQQWAFVAPGFVGSALISATAWHHDLVDESTGQVKRNLLGLGAVAVQRSRTSLGYDIPGDEMSASTGVPLRGAIAAALAGQLGAMQCPEPDVAEDRNGTPAHSPIADRQILLPLLRLGFNYLYDSFVNVQNLGSAPSTAILMAWDDSWSLWEDDPDYYKDDLSDCLRDCPGPTVVLCSGLLRPGATWRFMSSALPKDALSGMVFSFNEGAANQACSTLSAMKGSCDAFRRFQQAWSAGAAFGELDLAAARGGPVAVTVERVVPDADDPIVPGTHANASYEGLASQDLGAPRPSAGVYEYNLPYVRADGANFATSIFLQDAGPSCAQVKVCMRPAGACEGLGVCKTVFLHPGGGAEANTDAFLGPDDERPASVSVQSTMPLAIVAEVVGLDSNALMNYAASPRWARAVPGKPAVVAGSRIAYAPLTNGAYVGWNTAIHVTNQDPMLMAKVKVVYYNHSGGIEATQLDWICPGAAASFGLPALAHLEDRPWTGFVEVESLSFAENNLDPPPVRAGPAHISAVLSAVRNSSPDNVNEGVQSGMAYNLLAAPDVMADIPGSAGGAVPGASFGRASGVMAIPSLRNPPFGKLGPDDAVSELSVVNVVREPGYTDFSLLVMDQNGLVATACERVYAHSEVYLPMNEWPYLPPAFRGSALISAIHWTHEVEGSNGTIDHPLGLAAVVVERSGTVLQRTPAGSTQPAVSEIDGDEVSAVVGYPLDGETARALMAAVTGGQAIVCEPPRVATPTPSAVKR